MSSIFCCSCFKPASAPPAAGRTVAVAARGAGEQARAQQAASRAAAAAAQPQTTADRRWNIDEMADRRRQVEEMASLSGKDSLASNSSALASIPSQGQGPFTHPFHMSYSNATGKFVSRAAAAPASPSMDERSLQSASNSNTPAAVQLTQSAAKRALPEVSPKTIGAFKGVIV